MKTRAIGEITKIRIDLSLVEVDLLITELIGIIGSDWYHKNHKSDIIDDFYDSIVREYNEINEK